MQSRELHHWGTFRLSASAQTFSAQITSRIIVVVVPLLGIWKHAVALVAVGRDKNGKRSEIQVGPMGERLLTEL
jgi:hypothetical protein